MIRGVEEVRRRSMLAQELLNRMIGTKMDWSASGGNAHLLGDGWAENSRKSCSRVHDGAAWEAFRAGHGLGTPRAPFHAEMFLDRKAVADLPTSLMLQSRLHRCDGQIFNSSRMSGLLFTFD